MSDTETRVTKFDRLLITQPQQIRTALSPRTMHDLLNSVPLLFDVSDPEQIARAMKALEN